MESHFKHGNRWKKEKGLTLIETVIALSIIVIVSVSVVSMTIYSTNALSKTRLKSFFSGEADNYATLFVSYDAAGFAGAVNYLVGTSMTGYDETTIYYDSSYRITTADKSAYHTSFTYENEFKVLNIRVYDVNNNELFVRSVSK